MKIYHSKIMFVALMTTMSLFVHAEEVTKGDVIYTDDGVPIKFGAEYVTTSIPTLSNITFKEAPIARSWQPGDPIKEIPRRHWHDPRIKDNMPEPINPVLSAIDPLLAKQQNQDNQNLNNRGLTTGINIEGQGNTGVSPPDTVGEIGLDYYIQSINGSGGALIQIYNKDGTTAAGPSSMDALGSGACANGLGDPIILFDELAQRWMISEFSNSSNDLCVYVSQTSDPTGNWYNYSFLAPSFPDYPKYGVWPDAYYVGSNENVSAVYALERDKMLLGQAATMQRFSAPALNGFGFQVVTPADIDGTTPPPLDSPGIFMRHNDDESHNPGSNNPNNDFIEIFEFIVDFDTPGNSSFTGPTQISISEFDSNLCGLTSFSCIDQPNSGTDLDPLREPVMWRVAYRNFGDYETLVGNLATDVNGNDRAGVRWFELRNTGSGWTLFQEGTFSPDNDSRWMASAAMDAAGNIAMGYSVSGSSTFPSLAYNGRLASDPLGTLGSEQNIIAGSSPSNSNRWGDYASLSVDPVDGCTFWFTSEYTPSSSWSTRIASFSFSECFSPSFTLSATNLVQSVCVNPSANLSTIELDLAPMNDFNEVVTLAFDPVLPTGFSSPGFNPASLTPPGSSSVDIAINNTVSAGANNFQITGTSSSASNSVDVSVFVSTSAPSATTLQNPTDMSTTASLSPTFGWDAVADTSDYTLEIASDSGFNTIVFSTTQVGTNIVLPVGLLSGTTYYWRVRANNGCGSGSYSSVFEFTTPSLICNNSSFGIPDDSASGVDSVISVANSGSINDMDVQVQIDHSWVGDLIVELTNESTGTSVRLLNRPGRTNNGNGCSADNVDATFDDSASIVAENQCETTGSAAIIGDVIPFDDLSDFNNEELFGNWTLNVNDNAGQDTGSITNWCLMPSVVPPPTYTVSGNVTGATGPVTLTNNGTDNQVVALNGGFSFTPQNNGTTYVVEASGPFDQLCEVTGGSNGNGTGTINSDDVTVSVNCQTVPTYTVSGSVSDATGPVTLTNNGTDDQVVALNGSFSFTPQIDGSPYAVAASGPASQTCSVSGGTNGDGSGNINTDDVITTVSCIDTFSTASNDDFTVLEDATATIIDVLVNDSASSNGAAPITNVSDPNNGVSAITNNGDNVSYTPDAEYCNNGVTTDDFTYTITGGSRADVSVDVTCVNDAPSFDIDENIYIKLSDINAAEGEVGNIIACNVNLGPGTENSNQSIDGYTAEIIDPDNIINSLTVPVWGELSANYTGNTGIATINLTLKDNGGTDNGGIDSVTKQMKIHVNDYIFKGDFELETCL